MGVEGAIWRPETNEPPTPGLRAWPRRTGLSHGAASSGSAGSASGSVPSAGAPLAATGAGYTTVSVPSLGGSTGAAVGQQSVLNVKRGQVVIRSAAQYQELRNCDIFVDVGTHDRRIFNETGADGRDAGVQEQVLDHKLLTLLANVKNTIRRQLAIKHGSCVKVVIQSHRGMHRSVAMAEVLGQQCEAFAEVTVWHAAVPRWDPSYGPVPVDMGAAPRHGLIF